MVYKEVAGLNLSYLGLGNMRLPTVGSRGPIDREKAREIIEYAYEHGINYFDTAFRYHEGESESFVGEVLQQYPRDTWYLTSKMPGHMLQRRDGKLVFTGFQKEEVYDSLEDIFQTQLDRCRVEYFDFYLLHNLTETSYSFYTDEELKVVEYLLAEKKAGRIKHLGISAHGRAETIDKFLNLWEGVFEFIQIQINYLDWTLQDAKSKYEVAEKHGIPVVSMESCRGGMLASLGKEATAILKELRPNDSIASWAFRYLQALPNIKVVLSGMTTMEQLKENIALFAAPDPTTASEQEALQKVIATLVDAVPCTACRYCCEGCPQSLDIPKLISMYNEAGLDGVPSLRATLGAMSSDEMPAACVACGECSQVCPQSIDIPDVMAKFSDLISSAPQRRR